MKIFTYEKLYNAYLDCRKMKRKTINALKFEMDLENNLSGLHRELVNDAYAPGRSICFVVTEPAPREIFAADFRDRIVHHLFVREMIDQAEKMFIFDSYACRAGKGTHKAVKRLNRYISRVSRNNKAQAWYLKIDISSFFVSIDKEILFDILLGMIDRHKRPDGWKADMAKLAEIIIFHQADENYLMKGDKNLFRLIPPHKSLFFQDRSRGLPIGNYSSQFFANAYLNGVDQFIKRELRCRFYLRYVDDLILLTDNREQLKFWLRAIGDYARKNLLLSINPRKIIIQPVGRGLDFLGYFLKSNRIYPRRTVTGRYKNKLFKAAISRGEMSWQKSMAIAASYAGHSGYF